MRLFALVMVLGGCEKEPEGPDYTLRNAYVDGLCRYFAEGECADNIADSCGGSITFDDAADCSSFLRFGLSPCTGYNDVLIANEAVVQGCIDSLEAHDCANDPVCDAEGVSALESGDCAAVDALIDPLCPEDE